MLRMQPGFTFKLDKRAIRTLAAGGSVPIIAMTADAMKGVKEQVLAAGMNGYITKPFDPIELYSMLQRFIRKD
ncbi:response regulator [Paenibacillus cremeus]|nr:response regulator [Paenibacillus cremeus]